MSLIDWSDQLELGHAAIDQTHREFVELLNALGAAAGDSILPALDEFKAHTEAHFAQEEAWMAEKDFPPRHCHEREHANVLEIVTEVRSRVAGGELEYGERLASALAEWFPLHATSMDAMLALFLEKPELFAQPASACGTEGHVCGHEGEAHAPDPAQAATPETA